MELHTEKEQITHLQHFTFKLRNLYVKDKALFAQLNDFIPYSIHVNKRDNLDITYANNKLLDKGPELEKLVEIGGSYLTEISCPTLYKSAVARAEQFDKINDDDGVCNYLQHLRVNKQMKYFYSNKLILNENLYFNVSTFIDEMGTIGKLFKSIFTPLHKNQVSWLQFQSLTKQEKKVLKLLGNGLSNKEVGELLFISSHTVHTHRRNIYNKLNVKNISDLVRFSLILDLI
tara:strand:+ start:377 stop:1069 length:693 start_codon:yes stop_codon:yes gene_type:complete